MCARVCVSLLSITLLTSVFAAAQQPALLLSNDEFQAFLDCAKATGQAQIGACSRYVETHPHSAATEATLEILLTAYEQANDFTKLLATADKLLEINPSNLRALAFETSLRNRDAERLTDLVARQAAFEKAAAYARAGLNAQKPASMSDDDWSAQKHATQPVFETALSRLKPG